MGWGLAPSGTDVSKDISIHGGRGKGQDYLTQASPFSLLSAWKGAREQLIVGTGYEFTLLLLPLPNPEESCESFSVSNVHIEYSPDAVLYGFVGEYTVQSWGTQLGGIF